MMGAALTAGWAFTHPAVFLVFLGCAAILGVLAVVMHLENRRDDGRYRPAHSTRPGAHHGPGQGPGGQAPIPRRRLPGPHDPFAGDWPTLEQAIHHELPVAREWPLRDDPAGPAWLDAEPRPPEVADPLAGLAVKPPGPAIPAPGPGGPAPEPWLSAATYEQAWRARTGTLNISDKDWPWLAEGQYGHTALSGSQIMRALTDDDLDRIGELIRARDGAS